MVCRRILAPGAGVPGAWVLGAAIMVAALSLALAAESAWGDAGSQTVTIPSYFYPDTGAAGRWDRTDDDAQAVSLAVVNPHSGPGANRDPAYAARVEKSRTAQSTWAFRVR